MRPRRIVVVGAGGSGIPLAVRLVEAGHEVVVLEAGPRVAPASPAAPAPDDARTVRLCLPDGPVSWTYDAELFPGRPWRIGRGRLVGGSTAVNGAYFQRPHPDDFAVWAEVAGDEWTWEACLPALRRLESDLDFPDDPRHGGTGPMPVTRPPRDPATRAFLAAAAAAGAAEEHDKNGGGPSGAGLLPRNAVDAERRDVARSYLDASPAAAALDIRSGTTAVRVRIRSGRALGVEVDGDEGFVPADEVVLCAGAIETPRLLLRSGVGAPAAVSTDVALASPRRGVGRGLSDHPALELSWSARDGALAADPIAAWTAAWNAPAGTVADAPIEYLWAGLPTAAILTGDLRAGGPLDLRMTLARPRSRGAVSLGPDAVVRYDYLADPADLVALRAAVRTGARLLRDPALADAVAAADIPAWVDEAAADDVADAWIRARIGTALHSCGTARMGAEDDPDAVADPHGRVHGVEGLRVGDASLLPGVPSRGTALTAVLLGERIAELMRDE